MDNDYFGVPFGQAIGFSKATDLGLLFPGINDDYKEELSKHYHEFQSKEEMERFIENLKEENP